MKFNSILFAGVMAGVVASFGAFATDENIVASKGYVDEMDNVVYEDLDEIKQDKIPETDTRIARHTVIETTGENGVVTERGIFDGNSVTNNNENHLVTVGTVADFAASVERIQVPNNGMECVDEPDCTLWRVTTGTASLVSAGTFAPLTSGACAAIGASCTLNSDCCSGACSGLKTNLTCCGTYGATVSRASQCCSGVLQTSGLICGCASASDCPSAAPVCNTGTHTCRDGRI